jgi:hypothetical protein
MPLTDLQIRKAKPRQPWPIDNATDKHPARGAPKITSSLPTDDAFSPKPYRLWDGGGLYLEVAPSWRQVV